MSLQFLMKFNEQFRSWHQLSYSSGVEVEVSKFRIERLEPENLKLDLKSSNLNLSRDQNFRTGNAIASGSIDVAASKNVGFVSYCKENLGTCCAVSSCFRGLVDSYLEGSGNGPLELAQDQHSLETRTPCCYSRVSTVSAVSWFPKKWQPRAEPRVS